MLNVISGLLAGGVAASTNSYESIATVTVGSGGSSSITFSSIPSTYKHLQIRAISKTTATTNSDAYMVAQFNSDTTYTNYRLHVLYGTGSSAGASSVQNSFYNGAMVGDSVFSGSGQTSVFSGTVIDVLDYLDTNKNKVSRSLSGWDANGTGWIQFGSSLWTNTSAISSITLLNRDSSGSINFAQYSQFALYGIKG